MAGAQRVFCGTTADRLKLDLGFRSVRADYAMQHTPIERLDAAVLVKREDMCGGDGAPPFSKLRGLVRHLEGLKGEDIRTVAYVETAISMAGWGVAWAARRLGLRTILFDPQIKNPGEVLLAHRRLWRECGAEIRPVRPGRARVAYWIAKRELARTDPDAVMLDLGIPLEETIEETAAEWRWTMERVRPKTTVCAVGSGTIFAGIVRGWKIGEGRLIGVMTRSGDKDRKAASIRRRSGRVAAGLLFGDGVDFELVDEGWGYAEPCEVAVPFPTNRYYDAKAWAWLVKNIKELEAPVLFWNIGREVETKGVSNEKEERGIVG